MVSVGRWRIETISDQGEGVWNEDMVGYNAYAYWVLDGATPIEEKFVFSAEGDTHFLVREFSRELERMPERGSDENAALLKRAAASLRDRIVIPQGYKQDTVHEPGFAMSIVRIDAAGIQISILSDCYVVLNTKAGIEVYTDERIERIAQRTRMVQSVIEREKVGRETAKELLREQIRNNRKLMNTEEGYWVGTLDGIAFSHMKEKRRSLSGVTDILLCSDGFFKAFQCGAVALEAFFDRKPGLKTVMRQLREYEEKTRQVSALKGSDDASAIHVHVMT